MVIFINVILLTFSANCLKGEDFKRKIIFWVKIYVFDQKSKISRMFKKSVLDTKDTAYRS